MTDTRPERPARTRLTLAACGVVCVALSGGCKLFNKPSGSGTSDPPARVTDPLLGARIPPQHLPVPGKDGYAARERKDPLLAAPTAPDAAPEKGAPVSKPKQPSDGPPSANIGNPKEPYLPGRESTTAALAGHVQPDDSSLSIGDRRATGSTTGAPKGPVPLKPVAPDTSTAGGKTYEQLNADLKTLGAKLTPPATEGGQYVVRADVPYDRDNPGLVRRYEGAGATPAAALKDVLEHIRSDQGK